MSGAGVIVSDPWLQSQLTQVELRSLNSKVHTPLSLLRCKSRFESVHKTIRIRVLVCVVEDSER